MKQEYIICPVCGKHKFPTWEDNGCCICPYCGWGHDTMCEENVFDACGPNDLSLEDYKLRYEYYMSQNPKYYWRTDKYPNIPQIDKCLCPICRKFQFEPLTWDDIYCGITPTDVYCMQCGWHYDEEQQNLPNLTNGANMLSLNEYKCWYDKKITENSNYNYFDEVTDNYIPMPHKCPVCGKYEFADEACYDICPNCGWQDDGSQINEPDYDSGANTMSLKQYRKQYQDRIKANPNYKWKTQT